MFNSEESQNLSFHRSIPTARRSCCCNRYPRMSDARPSSNDMECSRIIDWNRGTPWVRRGSLKDQWKCSLSRYACRRLANGHFTQLCAYRDNRSDCEPETALLLLSVITACRCLSYHIDLLLVPRHKVWNLRRDYVSNKTILFCTIFVVLVRMRIVSQCSWIRYLYFSIVYLIFRQIV